MNKYKVIVEMGNMVEEYIIEAPTKIKAYTKCIRENRHLCLITQIKSKKIK